MISSPNELPTPIIVWFRQDFRVADNPSLHAASLRAAPVIPVFIDSREEEAPWTPGGASRWWLHQSLKALDKCLQGIGSRLIIRRGPTIQALRELVKQTGARTLLWNRRYEPAVITRDTTIKDIFRNEGCQTESFNAALLHEPWTIQNKSGNPFQVFTPFWKHCLEKPDPPVPLPSPKHLAPPEAWPHSLTLDSLELEPRVNWTLGMDAAWQPGEDGANTALKKFLADSFADYPEHRNRPDLSGTSLLSPHLHFGEISPRQVWHGLKQKAATQESQNEKWRNSQFLTEIGWREFSHHLLFHFPRTPTEPLRTAFKNFPWRDSSEWLRAWQKGQTGYPIVDAGMRELWTTGWMHNRVRMISASFLVKDLLLPWQEGARWFWDTLVDADLAQNTLGWQWSAGCGADAAPYFRIFNPVLQGEKFDPSGHYVRRWCPELAALPDKWIHRPHQAPKEILRASRIDLGRSYPEPIVNHSIACEIAREAFARIKSPLKVEN